MTSQIDDFIAEFEGELRDLRVYMGILHMFTTRPTQVREGRRSKPRWVVEVVLATKSHQDIYSELDTVIKDIMR
ncbi:hypothetical protein [Vulcanisaeta sp. JCM 16159]|uniref:hypothetical protein n=1 Tax=Vulcanisaeta sp. JCM 16159 TaxID=1295371 RepID=UPI0006D05E2E|nr:hypothetical protein [Vulcanisaeta sp. JCM 16159]